MKGTTPGAAREALGPQPIELDVGRVELIAGDPHTRLGLELTEFHLDPR